MNRLVGLSCVAILVFLGGCSSSSKKRAMSSQEMITADPLPLARGAKWEYQVTIKRYDPEANRETTKSLTWTTEVLDAKEANGVTAYRIKGWPTDLADLEASTTPAPSEKTVLRSGNNFMFGSSPEPVLDGAEGWFTWPVIDGQKICPSPEMVYCWQVAAVETGYTLSFYTGPDEQTYTLEPGTGVARYHYAHHGTTNEVEAKLTKFTAGKR
ncbi:MAG: hypothetical protein SFX73_11175 [Kofleriaceae bacterium]|nr:hypothetical protein [Kofleriaceae bacterium]